VKGKAPLIPEASAGQEFDPNTYSFRAPGITGTAVEGFLEARPEALGWRSSVNTNVGTAGGRISLPGVQAYSALE